MIISKLLSSGNGDKYIHKLIQVLEKLFNKLLSTDPITCDKLAKLSQKQLEIWFTDLEKAIYLILDEDRIYLVTENINNEPINCRISATIQDFMYLLTSQDEPQQILYEHNIIVEGEAGLLMALSGIMKDFEPDIEALLAPYLGDAGAYGMMQFSRECRRSLSYVHTQLKQNMKEWIQEESGLVPPKEQVELFKQQVTELQFVIDQLEQRVENLSRSKYKIE